MSPAVQAFLAVMCITGVIGCLLAVCHVAVLWSEGEL